MGVVFPDPELAGTPRVYFPTADGGVRKVSPVRLPAHETVYAMTVHKSQGSEFERVLLLLPDRDSELLSRELLYTGITRARSEVEVWGVKEIFATAVARRIERKSGLSDALWKNFAIDHQQSAIHFNPRRIHPLKCNKNKPLIYHIK